MRVGFALFGIVMVALWSGACGGSDEEGPLTIMAIGDSITHGEAGTPTYRCFLDAMLREEGVAFDFVGTRTMPYWGTDYDCPTEFDTDHEAESGVTVEGATSTVIASVQERQPDVALVQLGVNDIGGAQGSAARRAAPAETAAELEVLIRGIQEVSPDTTVLLAQGGRCDGRIYPYCDEQVPELNERIASFGELSTSTSAVVVVDMATGWTPDHLRDAWHPTAEGDRFIADRWLEALTATGLI